MLAINMVNAGAVEIARQANLPLACIHMVHPGMDGFPECDPQQAPLLVLAIDRTGKMFGPHLPRPTSFAQITENWSGSLFDQVAEHYFDTAQDYANFMKAGGISMRVIGYDMAARLPVVDTVEQNKQMMRQHLGSGWLVRQGVCAMPDGFEAMHEHIQEYTAGKCWFYAAALERMLGPDHHAVAFTLQPNLGSLQAGGYHACVKTPDGRYADIWGTHDKADIQSRFHARIIREEPLQECILRMLTSSSTPPDARMFELRVAQALSIAKRNPAHASRPAPSPRPLQRPHM